jgi:hypothetical protein
VFLSITINILLAAIGFSAFIYGLIIFIRMMNKDLVAKLPYSPGPHEFEVAEPGYYSISVFRAGKVSGSGVVVNVSVDDFPARVSRNIFSPRMRHGSHMATECWGFTTDRKGHCLLTFQNLESVVAHSSMLLLRQIVEPPVSHESLRILIHKNVTPLMSFLSIACTVGGGILAGFSIVKIFNSGAF